MTLELNILVLFRGSSWHLNYWNKGKSKIHRYPQQNIYNIVNTATEFKTGTKIKTTNIRWFQRLSLLCF